jgi:O-antigen/teichoic acid export membrane protein
MRFRNTLLRGGLASIILNISLAGLSFLISVALARLLGAEGFGAYSFAYALAMVLALPAQSGVSQLVIRETARGVISKEWGRVRGLWIWSNRTVLLLSMTMGFLLVGGALYLEADPEVLIAAGLIPFVALGSLRGAVLAGLHRVVLGQLPESVVRPLLLLFLIFVTPAFFGWEGLLPDQVMSMHVVAAIVAFAIGAILLFNVRPSEITFARPETNSSAWTRAVLPLSLVAGMQLLINNTDILMLGLLRSDSEVGVYRVVAQCSIFVMFGLQALNTVVAPHFARVFEERDLARLQHLAVTSARVGLLVAIPIGAAFLFWGGSILSILFGDEYVSGYLALVILMSGRILNAALGQVGLLLQMTGNEKYALFGTIVAASLNILLNILLIPPFGIEGAATATAIALVSSHLLLRHFVVVNIGIESSFAYFHSRSGQKT